MKNGNTKYCEWLLRNRWLVLILSFIVLLLTTSGGLYLEFNNDNRVFFSKTDPLLIALEEIENSYTKNDNIYIALAPKEGDVFNRKFLAAVEELTVTAWQIPYSSRVESFTNFQHTRADGDDLVVEDLVSDAESLDDKAIALIKKVALSDPMLKNSLVATDGSMVGMNIIVLKPGKSLDEIPEIMGFINDAVNEFRAKYPGIDVHITGGVPFDNAFGEISTDDMATLVPFMYVVMIVCIWLFLRSVVGAFATLLVIGFATATATAMGIQQF